MRGERLLTTEEVRQQRASAAAERARRAKTSDLARAARPFQAMLQAYRDLYAARGYPADALTPARCEAANVVGPALEMVDRVCLTFEQPGPAEDIARIARDQAAKAAR